ncbi:MAG: 30S ribosomal protein S5 [Mycoplasmataceae bacterium]|jgi:small subunit ribosomal protein S5|nr:30S ribosomal protein S5 [Mycoplasmataceae bacterium]
MNEKIKEGENPTAPKPGFNNRKPGGFRRNDASRSDGIETKMINIKQINKTTKGGRRMRFSALVVAGNKDGIVGYGIGKSVEVPVAIKKAEQDARKNLVKVLINKRHTLFHEVELKNGACTMLIKPAPSGTGIIAGGAVRAVLELAGYTDACSKKLGSNSKINMIQTTIKALQSQKTPGEYAKLRGKQVADIDSKIKAGERKGE